MKNLKSRLLAKIAISAETGCWNWTGSKSNGRYGKLEVAGKTLSAHRSSYEVHCGPIPGGLFVCHHCDNPACINPDHLFLGTASDNMEDKIRKGRQRARRGADVVGSKLKEADVIAIRESTGTISNSGIAREYGVDQSLISLIRSGKRWAYIKPATEAKTW